MLSARGGVTTNKLAFNHAAFGGSVIKQVNSTITPSPMCRFELRSQSLIAMHGERLVYESLEITSVVCGAKRPIFEMKGRIKDVWIYGGHASSR